MNIPPSSHFTPLSIRDAANEHRQKLPEELKAPDYFLGMEDILPFRGIPFDLGKEGGPNVILLNKNEVELPLGGIKANYVVFLHLVENRVSVYAEGFADDVLGGYDSGDLVSDYTIEYADSESHTHHIHRRFAIQQSAIRWGSNPFAAVPGQSNVVFRSNDEDIELGLVPRTWGRGECRTASGKTISPEKFWLYALPNPHPEKEIKSLRLTAREERSVIFGISAAHLPEHPLRFEPRRKLLLTLPEGLELNAIGELDDIGIDMGQVISARRQFVYPDGRWSDEEVDVQPIVAKDKIVVEYAAHPGAKLYVGLEGGSPQVFDLRKLSGQTVSEIPLAARPVRIRVIDGTTRQPVAVRLHIHGQAGEYLPPRGHHRKVNPGWFQDNYAEFINQNNQYAYIDGSCIADLPLGDVYFEITRGYEVSPIRRKIEITHETESIEFELERVLDWHSKGWVTADTHVHVLSPITAQLEGSAEDVNVVNLLASQWGEMFSNVGDFDGKSTYGSVESGSSGEFLVRVGSENRMQILGHISLLGYSGELIHPLCSGGPTESALGDPQEVTMAEWAQKCIDQGGLVVMPHAPDPQCERAADIVLGLVNAVEMMTFTPYDIQIRPYGLADWYRFLNLGYHLPVVGGSDKMSAASLLGGVRTYTQMGDRPFNYENWMDAVRAGNTFVTVGPLVNFKVEGKSPGDRIQLPPTGGTVNVSWQVESVRLPIEEVEVIEGGLVRHQQSVDGQLQSKGSVELKIEDSTWLGLRVRGSYQNRPGDIAAHSSVVQVLVGQKPIYSPKDASDILRQIEGTIAYIDTIATRPEADRYRRVRASLEAAHNRLHQKMHRHGVYHKHSTVHDHSEHHEH